LRKLLLFPVLFCLIFSGCTVQTPEKRFHELRTQYEEADTVRLCGEVSVKLQDTWFSFVLRYEESENSGLLTVEQPETIAGLCARVSQEDGIALSYDGVSLYVGELGEYAVSPMSIMPLMLQIMQLQYPLSIGYTCVEGADCLEVEYEPEPGLLLRCWFDRETFLPVLSELYVDEALTVSCVFQECLLLSRGESVFFAESH